jgi:conjugative transfer signal peptidase TraF
LAAPPQGEAVTRRPTTLIAMVAAIALMAFAGSKPAPVLVWNASESVPVGLYHVRPTHMLFITTLVVAFPPEPLATYLAQRGYLPRGVPLLKRILALSGQSVCRNELLISVDGVDVGAARERDHRDRALPVWQGCRVIADGEVFLMNWDEPSSFDGRYFGPIPSSAIIGRAQPMLTFEKD